jgi:NAD(P)-dependent dehydrogenase (short-subunit alcohol dehydrogenase family)
MQDVHVMSGEGPLAGKVVLIAGCSQDVCEATARLFAQRGAEGLLIGGRGIEQGQAVAAIISAAGCPAEFLPADFTKLDDCAALVAKADQVYGRIDLVIFAAGMVAPRSGQEPLTEQFDHIVAINLRAPFFLMLAAARLMQRDTTPGTMMTVLGMPAGGDPVALAAYETSQGGLAALTRSFAAGLVEEQIRVIGLDLGGCDALGDGAVTGAMFSGEPRRPSRTPQEIAGALALLAAEPARAETGSIVLIDQLPPTAPHAQPRPTA